MNNNKERQAYYSKAKQKMNEARETIASIIKNDDSSKASLYVLLASIDELTGRLSDNTDINRDAYFYVSFLKGTFVELGADYLPYMDLEGESVAPFNLCKRTFEQGQSKDAVRKAVMCSKHSSY